MFVKNNLSINVLNANHNSIDYKFKSCNPSCFKIHECKVLEKIIENNQNSELNELVLDEDNDHIV